MLYHPAFAAAFLKYFAYRRSLYPAASLFFGRSPLPSADLHRIPDPGLSTWESSDQNDKRLKRQKLNRDKGEETPLYGIWNCLLPVQIRCLVLLFGKE